MKKLFTLALCLTLQPLLQAQLVTPGIPGSVNTNVPKADYTVVARTANSRSWGTIVSYTNKTAKMMTGTNAGNAVSSRANTTYTVMTRTNVAYMEVAANLCVQDASGTWSDSDSSLAIVADGASSGNSPLAVHFSGDANAQGGAVRLTTPDGKVFLSKVYGISYYDSGLQTNVLLATLRSSQGLLVGSNHIVFQNTFDGLNADLWYTYTRSRLEQDVVLHEAPPSPAACGLNAQNVRLQIWTEWFSPPEPRITTGEDDGILCDAYLDFGGIIMVPGAALFTQGQADLAPVESGAIYKHWGKVAQRDWLIEEIPIEKIANVLQALPLHASAGKPGQSLYEHLASTQPLRPKTGTTGPVTPVQIAKNFEQEAGLVLDYNLVSSVANFTFQSDTTYYLPTSVVMSGSNTTFEGGTILKYASGAGLTVNTPITWLGSPFMPVILTAKDDSSMGDLISGSTGNPGTAYYASPALYYNASMAGTNLVLHDLRVLNAKTAVTINGQSNHVVSSVQMVNCGNGLAATNTTYSFWNGLMWNVMTNFTGTNSMGDVEQLTVDTANWLNKGQTLNLTNCLLVAVTNKGSFTSNSVYTANSGGSVFQTVGGGSHYLPTNSPYLAEGTANIAPPLAATLRQLTTYAPVLLTSDFSANRTLSPAVPRDTGRPAVGYHYYPLDFVCHDVNVDSGVTLMLTNGVSLGFMDTTGITVNGSLISQGTPTNLNHVMSVDAAQETATSEEYYFMLIGWNASWQNLYFRFTDLPNPGGGQAAQLWMDDGWTGADYLAAGPITMLDSQMRAGRIWMNLGDNNNPSTSSSETLNMTNNLIDRGVIYYLRSANLNGNGDYTPANLVVNNYNNLYHYGLLDLVFNMASFEDGQPGDPWPLPWALYDNLFECTNFTETGTDSIDGNTWPTLIANGHNGYVYQAALLASSGWDVTPAVDDYQTGPLGPFYYPTCGGNLSTLIYAGDQPAANLGLDSETVMTNNVPEGTNIVSIGYHHASVGSVNFYTNCTANPGGVLSISSGAFCVGEPAFDMAYWTDIPGQVSEVYLGSGGIPVWFSLPVYSTILTNWNVVDWDGSLVTNGGSGLFFTPTNTGVGTNVFYYTYSNPPPCSPGPYTISISNTFAVVGVASLAPTNTGTWIEITNSTPGTRTFLVRANPTNGHNTLAVHATPTPIVAPANLPSCWSLNGVWTNVVFLNIAGPGVYEVNCVCGTSSLTDYFVVTTNAVTNNSTVDAPCGTGPWQLGYWSFNVPSVLLDYWSGDSNALDTLGIYTNNGTLHGNVTYTNGVLSNAFSFDGNSSYISFGTNAGNFGTNNFTVDFWMETTATGQQQGILDKRPYCGAASMWDIRLESSGTLSVEICSNSSGTDYIGFASRGRVNDGSFHHVTLNRWGTNITLFIDGAVDTKVSSTGVANIQNSTSFTAGSSACIGDDGTGYFVGILDEIVLWQGEMNPWYSSRNWPPLQYYNVENPVTPWTNGLLVDSPNAAKLAYNYIESDGSANLNGSQGAVQFWFNPDWNGGTGTGAPGYWFELGDVYSPGGGWALVTDPAGTGLSFVSGSNGFVMTYLTAPIGGWVSNTWHQIALSYSPSATLLFVDGALATNGPGLFFEPDLATRLADGFTVGSDHNGAGEAGGVFDELATFNCPLTQAQVTSNYPYPAILAQPAGQTVAAADTVLFSVAAGSPSGLNYQWQLNGVNLAASARIGGVTGSTLSVADVSDADAGSYSVIVGNALMSVTSAVAVLTLNDAAQLGQWYFTTTNWLGQQGQSPVLATNLALTPGWSTNCLLLDTNVPARLVYRDVETNVSTNFYPANIDFHTGSVVWWVKPDWNSTNSGGNGPGNNAVLLMVASTNQTTVNEWWVGISADGGTLTFNTSSNGVATLQGSGPIWWTSNTWHQVVLTYDSNYSYLYVDGYPAADGGGVTNWPARSVTNQGFAVGSDLSGNSQMRGALADLETYNYELGMGDIEDSFDAVEPGGVDYSISFNTTYTSNAVVTAAIDGWPSASMMILVNSTNTNSGVWIPFNASPTINLGSGDGPKTVNIYFNTLSNVVSSCSFTLWLDTTPPAIVITAPGPGTNTVNQPLLQLQGCAPEELSSVTYDIANATGTMTNQPAVILSRYFDTNQWRFTTNTFQAFDIGLTVGANQITVHAKDLAGNMTTTNLTYTLDYTGKSNPVLTLYWPTNGAQISGTNFVWRGSVDDPTVTLSAQITDASGDTNVVTGIVERNGNFWVENLPLASGINSLTLTATDAAGNVSQTNISVTQSLVNMAITSVPAVSNQLSVTVLGTIDTAGYTVWVNGVKATQNGSPPSINWEADNVPVNGLGTTVFEALAIADTDNGGNGTTGSGGGGTNSTLQNLGNPVPAVVSPVAQAEQDTQPAIICTYYNLANDILWTDIGTNGAPNGLGEVAWNLVNEFYKCDQWAYASSGSLLNTLWANYYHSGNDPYTPPYPIGFGASLETWDGLGNAVFTSYTSTNDNDFSQPQPSTYGTVPMDGPGYYPEESSYHFTTTPWSSTWLMDQPNTGVPAVYKITRGVASSYSLRTGGKAASNQQQLFALAVTATNMTHLGNPSFPPGSSGVQVPYNDITVMGQPLGADGNLWVVEPDGITVPIPVNVRGSPSFFFNIIPTKYKSYFTAYVCQPYPNWPNDMRLYPYPPGPPLGYPIVDLGGVLGGHAWWKLSTDAPISAIRQFTAPRNARWVNIEVGYGPRTSPSFSEWLNAINNVTSPSCPGILPFISTDTATVQGTYSVGFPGLIAGLNHTEHICEHPGAYDLIYHNCVIETRITGGAAGISLPRTWDPEDFGALLPPSTQ